MLGGIAGAFVLYMIASGQPGFDLSGGLASNGFGEHSPGGYSMASGFLTEVVMTLMFLVIILGATDRARTGGLRPDRDRPRPDADPPDQHPGHQHVREPGTQHRSGRCSSATGRSASLWLFWVAPIIGALVAGYLYRWLGNEK